MTSIVLHGRGSCGLPPAGASLGAFVTDRLIEIEQVKDPRVGGGSDHVHLAVLAHGDG